MDRRNMQGNRGRYGRDYRGERGYGENRPEHRRREELPWPEPDTIDPPDPCQPEIAGQKYPFKLPPLPYANHALEPFIDALTMQLHHDRHLKTYVDNLNAAVEGAQQFWEWPLEKLLKYADWLPENLKTAVQHNGGGVYNHEFFFQNLTAKKATKPSDELQKRLAKVFGSMDHFKTRMKKAAMDVFGSGYAWLVQDKDGNLRIITTQNQQTPVELGMCPVMGIDVWEHAYYLKHYNVRADYIDDWFSVVDWEKASQNLKE